MLGLGYVGLPLAMEFAAVTSVIGYDTNRQRVAQLRRGIIANAATGSRELQVALGHGLRLTHNAGDLSGCKTFIICVPTPVGPSGIPDLGPVQEAAKVCADYMADGALVVLESTTYPGTTRNVVLPIVEAKGWHLGDNLLLAYSPERIDPGNRDFALVNIPKLVGGLDRRSGEAASLVYQSIMKAQLIEVSSPEVAEAAKMLENVYRNVNIALINELSIVFDHLGINSWEVVEAASTKPYGFQPFFPGPGVGGHCIPVDPLYLSYRARQVGVVPRFIELGSHVNNLMPIHVVNLVEVAARQLGLDKLRGTRVAVLGLSYKRDIPDTRESPSIAIVEELLRRGASVTVHDPMAPIPEQLRQGVSIGSTVERAVASSEIIVFAVDHSAYEKKVRSILAKWGEHRMFVDCRNLLPVASDRVIGIGKGNRV